MDMTAYFMGRNAAEAGGVSGEGLNIIEKVDVTETHSSRDVYNAPALDIAFEELNEKLDEKQEDLGGEKIHEITLAKSERAYIQNLQPGFYVVHAPEGGAIVGGTAIHLTKGDSHLMTSGDYTQETADAAGVTKFRKSYYLTYSVTSNGAGCVYGIFEGNKANGAWTYTKIDGGQFESNSNKCFIINDTTTADNIKYPSAKAVKTYVEEQLKNVGDEEWEHICDIKFVTDEEVTVVTQDLGAEYKKLLLYANKDSAGGLTSDARDSYVFEIKADNKIISRVGNNRNGGWSLHIFNIEWFQDISIFLSEHFDGSLNGKEGISGTREKPFTKLSFHTDGVKPDGTVCTFGNFTMNIYGVRV